MQNLYLRSEKGTELTWEEVDTNWTRIKNAVDGLELSLEDTRANKEWIMPLLLKELDNANISLINYEYNPVTNSDPFTGLLYNNIDNTKAGVYILYDGISNDLLSIGIGSETDDYTAIINTNWNDGVPELNYRIIRHTPLSSVMIGIEPDEAFINLLTSRMLTIRDDNGTPHIGFFGDHAPQQAISETTTDPAITELQDILIAYGLAIDNRNP